MTNVNFNNVTGGATPQRIQKIEELEKRLTVAELSRLRLEECTDERSGQRYGRAKCRAGQCEKIGGGGRNRGSRYSYQVWAVWS